MRHARLSLTAMTTLLFVQGARAEGSTELDIGDSASSRAHDQELSLTAVLNADIMNNGAEKICWKGTGSLTVSRPDNNVLLGTIASGSCLDAVVGVTGAYKLRLTANQVAGVEWDVRVCAGSVSSASCLSTPANEQLGRLWSTKWDFSNANTGFTEDYAVNGSVYAIVPAGGAGREAVIEMRMTGVSGYRYQLAANSIGPRRTTDGVRIGRSVQVGATYTYDPEFPLYLSPPARALYNSVSPVVSSLSAAPSCGTGVVLDRAPAVIGFDSNVNAQYVVVCDLNKDGVFDLASSADFSAFGTAAIGRTSLSWNGRNNSGANAAPGSYACKIRLNVGEFHYIAQDIETSYPGIRMYRVEADRVTRTPIRMFWDDGIIAPDSELMPNGNASPSAPTAAGLDPGPYSAASTAYSTGSMGNARAWGNFDADGKGNDSLLDQFASADTMESPPLTVSVTANNGDADGDGLVNTRECDLGTDPQDSDSDDDGVGDGYEATNVTAKDTDADGTIDALDSDDDGDGVATRTELAGENGDGNPADAPNTDGKPDGANYLDVDSDDDGVRDGLDVAATNPNICRDVDVDNCDDCSSTGANGSGGDPRNDGRDSNGDGYCDLTDDDDDGDGVPDAMDTNPLVPTICLDADGDSCDDCALGAGPATQNDGLDSDADGACNLGDPDDDNDGVQDVLDRAPLNASSCRDLDMDGCDDCSSTGADNSGGDTRADGPDANGDGICDVGDPNIDRDHDGVRDAVDLAPDNPYVCQDVDGDRCDDCALTGADGSGGAPSADGPDADRDGICDAGDDDDDDDGVPDSADVASVNALSCRDVDSDTCDDCALTGANHSGGSVSRDGPDADGDGRCDAGDPDDDNDGVVDSVDTAPLNPSVCRDADADGCDDCVNTGADGRGGDPSNDGLDSDADGLCNLGDPDDDNDGVVDTADSAKLNPRACRDLDADRCDDCSLTGADRSGGSTARDGADADGDGICDLGDLDRDGDTVRDDADTDADDPAVCQDSDGDTCDDCALRLGPVPANDGNDSDGDGQCDRGDLDDDNDGVPDAADIEPLEPRLCRDRDADRCDDCGLTGADNSGGAPGNDGTDIDADGICDQGDNDDDNDGVVDGSDSRPLDPNVCRDLDKDGCDDCTFTGANHSGGSPSHDGIDTDADGLCDGGDPDDDDDGVLDALDRAPQNAKQCRDLDADQCDDCSLTGADHSGGNVARDGADYNQDGTCDLTDPNLDLDGDGVRDEADRDRDDPRVCRDQDLDTCDDCSEGRGPSASRDGPDQDMDGLCDAGDLDDDADGVPDAMDQAPLNPHACRDLDGDRCDDCTFTGANNSGGAPAADGLDADADGTCDVGDGDDDDDGVLDPDDRLPREASACRDVDQDGCDDCTISRANKSGGWTPFDGIDSDLDGLCNQGDPDDDGDGVVDPADSMPLVATACRDVDADRCDDCALTGADGSGGDPRRDGKDADGDGKCDGVDTDGDGVDDGMDRAPRDPHQCRDDDGDLCDDCSQGRYDPAHDGSDLDADGRCDAASDRDGDGVSDALDLDDDGDGILDHQEAVLGISPEADHDRDGIPNYRDVSDRGDGLANTCADLLGDGTCDQLSVIYDSDQDGTPNHWDLDSDGDTLYDADESGRAALDADRDGIVDGPVGTNGVADVLEPVVDLGQLAPPVDTDGDSLPDALDLDSDADGVSDRREAGDETLATPPRDSDGDRKLDFQDADDDGDGVPTRDELRAGTELHDTDADSIPDYLDSDDDGDGLATAQEHAADADLDRDGSPDYLDDDDDGDGVPTLVERRGGFGVGIDVDTEGDGMPDYRDPDDDDDRIPTLDEPGDANRDGVPDRLQPPSKPGTLSGGGQCTLTPGPARLPPLEVLLSFAMVWLLRRRRQARRAPARAGVLLAGLLVTASARAQVTLDTIKPTPFAADGFALSRPFVPGHRKGTAMVMLDYANDPLVYEQVARVPTSEQHVVRHQLVAHVGAGIGLGERAAIYGMLPIHAVMRGAAIARELAPRADGAGLGDLALGGRAILLEPKSRRSALAGELLARVPTASLSRSGQHYSGDKVGSYEAALNGELRFGRLDVRARLGARLRKGEELGNLRLGHELLLGLAGRYLLRDQLRLHVELFGSTFTAGVLQRERTAVEGLLGLRYEGVRLLLGIAAGTAFSRGFGAADLRLLATLGASFSAQRAAHPVPRDRDGDGLLDAKDQCPEEPEDRDQYQDADGCPDPDNDGDLVLDTVDKCISTPEDRDRFEDADGCPDPDNDQDSYPDVTDPCPLEPEDIDGFQEEGCPDNDNDGDGFPDLADSCRDRPEDRDHFEDADGCPELDNDGDGLLDPQDACPNQPEDHDGDRDSDGCPEADSSLVKVTCEQLEIKERVYFDVDRDTIQSRSFRLLDEVATALNAAAHIRRVRIEGHTDDRGNDAYNLALSQRRAAAVERYLVEHDVRPARLEALGLGETRPLSPQKSARARDQNRRVEFHILSQDAACLPEPASGAAGAQTKQ